MLEARILKQSEENLWEEFIKTHPLSTIHQASAWGHFLAKISSRGKYWIIVLEEKNKIVGGTLLVRHALPRGYSWLYAPRGPLLDYNYTEKQMEELMSVIQKIAKEENAIFLRVDPPIIQRSGHLQKCDKIAPVPHFKNFFAVKHGFQPEHTLLIDLTKSHEEILRNMKQKGRYNIRLAEKKGVKIHKVNYEKPKEFLKDIEHFYEILKETVKRDHFHGHDLSYYQSMLDTLCCHKNAELYLAEYNRKIIAGIIVTFFKDTATYYYGASGNDFRNIMASYLLQWSVIKEAKKEGYKYYDFFGISPTLQNGIHIKKHPWQGVTDFKTKFGGEKISYASAQEYPFKKFLYFLYRIYKTI